MIFFFGTRSTQIAAHEAKANCTHCQQEAVWLFVYQHYFHIFWIPAFPLWRSTVSVCGHCKQTLTKRDFLPELQEDYTIVKQQAKTPWWTFFLLIAVVLLIVGSTILSRFS
ncbi:hypothetical protein [Sphingobacterium paucimobilis]|uniref:Zinc-ribbon 15 domain-containing protein n=1 Tax=Sphingobacterium paucimobilis HER1398 TaxID=1346330 RepID=U2IYZ4_9SPHI|nr:hypothetical protein [Sphingobacterium paucimobilis]ERJ57924.1 hypothetical protein M472_04005 [Sphingobacterium paucimobilis HER1398]